MWKGVNGHATPKMITGSTPTTKWEEMMESPEYKEWLPKAYERELNESWVEYVPLAQLLPLREYHWNDEYNRHGKEQFLDTVEDIKRHGVRSPITIRYFKDTDTALIIEGNHRVAAARAAGLTEVPARVTIASYPRKDYGKDTGAHDGGLFVVCWIRTTAFMTITSSPQILGSLEAKRKQPPRLSPTRRSESQRLTIFNRFPSSNSVKRRDSRVLRR